ncbi:hypothetical protein N658DRAFT_524613 [Parathielavia hyrcaniae]|uniref:Uncharacterized protein n=1 Tax=Parathielavia hyrcaniae TaxID=113614 RepID=A0AAN6Q0D8_9PEZI|nr:hypothetical protein N658DRAFT_524613 [Parathielavia hyrcaniae]
MSDKPDTLERGQSPPPERSSGKQMIDPPASGHGTNKVPHKADANKEAIEHLTSNPKGPMEDHAEQQTAKGPVESQLAA